MIDLKAAWKRCASFTGRAIGKSLDHNNVSRELPEARCCTATGLFVWIWMPPAAGSAGAAAKKEVTMGVFLTVIITGLIIALKVHKDERVKVTITDSDIIHPAEFELRDHYFTRCSN
ncbi:MAG TPA: hypothetical protein VEB40_04985 [Flavipsychrobacter sp.]|nr:hypothetical protein [Flavipsychrobacter sp.]